MKANFMVYLNDGFVDRISANTDNALEEIIEIVCPGAKLVSADGSAMDSVTAKLDNGSKLDLVNLENCI